MINGTDHLTAKELAEKLDGRREGSYWKAHCPGHEDARSSLSISETARKVLLHCHAGCTQDAVIDALRDRGLWPERHANGGAGGSRTIAAIYDYVDQAGDLQFQVMRYAPKDFRQRRRPRPDDAPDKVHGGWVWSVDGVRIVPYRLPEVLEAIANQRPIFIPEGEKDVDNLAKLGITATCNAGGALKWKAEHSACLKDASAIIIPDNDGPGRKHAESVAASLAGIAMRIKILELPGLPPKGDVSDWLAGGGTAEKLWALAEQAPERGKGTASSDALPHWQVEPWHEAVASADLLDALCAILRRYMVLPQHAAEALSLWVLHAWTAASRDVV